MHGDVSVVDDALHLAASLRGGTAGDAGKQSVSTTDGSHTVLGDQGPPAKSLLARGSAADLQIIQDHVRHPNDQELSQTAQTHGSDGNRPSKRKRLETISEFEIHQQRSPNVDGMLQRRSSRDEMPPPTQLLHDTTWTNLNQPVVARRYQSINQVPGGHDRSDSTHLDNDYTLSNNGSAGYSFRNVPEERPCGEFASVASPAPNYPRNRQFDDGELDRDFRFTAPSRLESRLSGVSPNRLTLPPSTPSVVSHRFPRRIGLSANVRTSKPPLPTPENSRSPERRVGYRPTTQTNAAPAASPYFRSRTLTTSQMVTSPFINRPSQPMAPPNPRSYTSCNNPPMHTPAASTPWKLSWLTAPYKRDQSDTPGRRQGSSTEQRLQNGSGAYRHPGGHQNANNDDRRPSNNSFSFTDQPRINSTDGGRSSRAAFASHGRRPARR